ncbi:MAG: ribose-phosphate diphosphokinase [Candidatus Heimdallarchaeaceae archaeon]
MHICSKLENIFIFAGSGLNSRQIAQNIAGIMGLPYIELSTRVFPDSEILVRIPVEKVDVKEKHIIYVQSTAPKWETKRTTQSMWIPQSQSLMELFLTLDTIKEKKAKTIDVVIPYLAHARQDKEFRKGEVVSTRAIAKILKCLGADRIFTVDIHAHRETGWFFFGQTKDFPGVKAYNITAARALAEYVRDNLKIQSPIVIIPDEGHRPIAEKIKDILEPEDVVFLYKKRLSPTEVKLLHVKKIDLKGKNVVIFDDMISTGRTIAKAAMFAKKNGAKNVVVAVTHTLYIKDARSTLLKAGVDRIVATDTVPSEDSVVPIAPIIAKALREIIF